MANNLKHTLKVADNIVVYGDDSSGLVCRKGVRLTYKQTQM